MNTPIDQLANNLETKEVLTEEDIVTLIAIFNREMLGNVEGPNCTDRSVCNNNCCSIMIDIPHLLARKYIIDGRLEPGDVRRGDTFAWMLNVHQDTNKCVFFSPMLYGCRAYVDDLNTRPPQCAVYPAGYIAGSTACKAGAGPWIVRDKVIGNACQRLMEIYKRYCLEERQRIKQRLHEDLQDSFGANFLELLSQASPQDVVGIKETWNGFEPLLAEGHSFSFKQFCDSTCEIPFLECEKVCGIAIDHFLDFLRQTIPAFITSCDMKEEYTLIELRKFLK